MRDPVSQTTSRMHRTIFTTPVVNTALRAFSLTTLRLLGWQVQGALPAHMPKAVLIAAPHTSNWDLPYTLMVAFALRLNVYWMGKSSLFRWPFGPVMRWLGGIAVDREKSSNLVAASAAAISAADGTLQLVVPPEGTRGKTRHWRTGFYFIALQAQVPIILAFMDYERKVSGLGPVFTPTGDVEADMAQIKLFYADIKGKHAQKFEAE
jgi:1-acyl-sn-glycerol-3-phosphate acyltransferase